VLLWPLKGNKSAEHESQQSVERADKVEESGSGKEGYELSPMSNNENYYFTLWRTKVSIFPTLVTDRFGNTVRYVFDPDDKWQC
jgi:hypothetical protein